MTSSTHVAGQMPAMLGDEGVLRHVLVVGGNSQEWAAMTLDGWRARADELGGFCSELGVPWLTILIYAGDGRGALTTQTRFEAGNCTVTVDPFGDGHARFATAMHAIPDDVDINEKTVAAALYAPAEDEPDLVVVLGPSTALPPSLVWELAYAELVFLPTAWSQLGTVQLAEAVTDFSGRRRRFGGLDPD